MPRRKPWAIPKSNAADSRILLAPATRGKDTYLVCALLRDRLANGVPHRIASHRTCPEIELTSNDWRMAELALGRGTYRQHTMLIELPRWHRMETEWNGTRASWYSIRIR